MEKEIDALRETEEEKAFETDFDFENDKEFAALLNGTLSREFDEAGISVSEDLIAKTMSRINRLEKEDDGKEQKITAIPRKKKTMYYAKLAAGIAAAAFIGVIGIAVIRNNLVTKSSDMAVNEGSNYKKQESATYDMAESSATSDMPTSDRMNDSASESPRVFADSASMAMTDGCADEKEDFSLKAAGESILSEAEKFDSDVSDDMYSDVDCGDNEDDTDYTFEEETDIEAFPGSSTDAAVPVADATTVCDDIFALDIIEKNESSGYNDEENELYGLNPVSSEQYQDILAVLEEDCIDLNTPFESQEMTDDERNRDIADDYLYGIICETDGADGNGIFMYDDRVVLYSWPAGNDEDMSGYVKNVFSFSEAYEASKVAGLIYGIVAGN